jgi:tryptophan-rich sensory protein
MRLDADRVLARLSWLGYVVVPGWLVLTGLMVLAYRRIPDGSSPVARIGVVVLIAATWLQPVATGTGLLTGRQSIAVYAVILAVVLAVVASVSWQAALLIAPTAAWLVVAGLYTWASTEPRPSA